MKADAWMPLYIADYLRDTLHLSRDQHGAYLLLLMACWTRGGRLPNDPAQLAAMAKASHAEWRKLAPVILPFFSVEGAELVHGRVVEEHQKAAKLSAARREAGAKGGRPSKQTESHEKPIGFANQNQNGLQTETPAQVARPSPTPVRLIPEPVEKAEQSVSGQAAPSKGSRLPRNWKADPSMIAFAVMEGFAPEQVERIEQDFRDFWTAKTGASATKLDWDATWRRWVRNTDRRKVQMACAPAPKRVGFV